MASRTIPVTLLSGFAGSGKTAVIEHLKRALGARRPAFLLEDEETDLFSQIENAVEMEGADVLIIEAVCHEEPFFIADVLTNGEETEPPPRGIRIDTAVTVIDATRFIDQLTAGDDLIDVYEECDPEDDRTVPEIVIEQVEFADVILVNKIDLCNDAQLLRVEALLERLNPRAKIIRTSHGRVRPDEVIGTGLFDFDETDEGAGWLAELRGEFEGSSSPEGVTSFTYVDRRPFHPIRFNELLGDFSITGLVRAKGSVWVATRHHEIGVWSLAGRTSLLSYGGAWFAATPARQWPPDERERAEIMADWVPPFGDRRQEIAFICIDGNEAEIRERLDECLLTSNEMRDGPDSWFAIPDPLPDWHVEGEDASGH